MLCLSILTNYSVTIEYQHDTYIVDLFKQNLDSTFFSVYAQTSPLKYTQATVGLWIFLPLIFIRVECQTRDNFLYCILN